VVVCSLKAQRRSASSWVPLDILEAHSCAILAIGIIWGIGSSEEPAVAGAERARSILNAEVATLGCLDYDRHRLEYNEHLVTLATMLFCCSRT